MLFSNPILKVGSKLDFTNDLRIFNSFQFNSKTYLKVVTQ